MFVKMKKYSSATILSRFLSKIGLYSISNKLDGYRDEKRIKVKIHNYDVWSLDHTLAQIIVPALQKLKKQKHGTPYVDFEDAPDHLLPDDLEEALRKMNYDGTTDEFFHDRWDWALGEMIFAFEAYKNAIFLDVEYLENEEENNERVENGMRLFAKYYGALWD